MEVLTKDEVLKRVSQARLAKLNIFAEKPNTETIDDPDWVASSVGEKPAQIPKYTDLEWFNEIVWRYFETLNARGREMLAKQAAEPVEDIREP